MSLFFEELDYRPTPIGALSLRRRRELSLGVDIHEIMLGDEHLMSSLFTASEIALGRLCMEALDEGRRDAGRGDADRTGGSDGYRVLVGGLGLGYTAKAVLDSGRAASLLVIDLLDPVIDWHRDGVLPLGTALADDPRCRLHQGDFFALAASAAGFDMQAPGSRFDAILLDIDHSPEVFLDERSAGFYQAEGLAALARHLEPGGIFGLWSNDRPDPHFTERLAGVFAEARAVPVTFDNPLQNRPFTQTVYIARAGSEE